LIIDMPPKTAEPARVLRYGPMPDTAGSGAHCGGMAQVLEFQSASPNAFETTRNRDRSLFRPWA
jgi:N-methylhydantoinase B